MDVRERKRLYMKEYRKKNKDSLRIKSRVWKTKNPDKLKQYRETYKVKLGPSGVKTQYRRQHLKQCYGLSLEQYDDMLKLQDRKCAICQITYENSLNRDEKQFHVDHNHETGVVRGLLCSLCNKGLGTFGDRSDLLQNAIVYLSLHSK